MPPTAPSSHLLTLLQVAQQLGVSTRTVVRLRDDGALPCVRIRGALRFDADDVAKLVERGRPTPTPNDTNSP